MFGRVVGVNICFVPTTEACKLEGILLQKLKAPLHFGVKLLLQNERESSYGYCHKLPCIPQLIYTLVNWE